MQEVSMLPTFPLNTVEQVESFNNLLNDENVWRQFINKISRIGGEGVPKNVRNIMSTIFGYEVAQLYTWTGQKKTLSLKKNRISDAIIASLLKNSKVTITEIESCMQEWLRRSGDRLRALLKK
ncbi:hypothetical protein PUN28_017008 [Cardiocondyla obscurior]|uniref:DUF4806 domain-containing protein n=1 Tax=Cardiocondyla obscurior TaxID=286306 RepID=A0AAW2ENV7_9HYME